MAETFKKVSTGYLEAKLLQLSKQFRQAIDNGEVFWNVKKIYLKLRGYKSSLLHQFPLKKGLPFKQYMLN